MKIAAVVLAVALAAGCVWVRFASTPASAHASAQAAAHATAAAAATAEQVPTLGLTGQAPGPHREITAAEWRGIASNPDAHVGERIIVYGEIVEVDSGVADHFRARVDGAPYDTRPVHSGHTTKTVFVCAAAGPQSRAVGELFQARVTVAGALPYKTTFGGNAAVPVLAIDSIKATGLPDDRRSDHGLEAGVGAPHTSIR